MRAVEIIRDNPSIVNNPRLIWVMIVGEDKKYNSQMDVVCELYKAGWILV